MKRIIYLFAVVILGFTLSSCVDLDLEPKGVFDEATLFNSDYGVMTYLGAIYNELPIEDFNYYHNRGYPSTTNDISDGNAWEAQKNSPAVPGAEAAGRRDGDGTFEYWPYERIRRINNFIEAIPTYSEYHSEEQINAYVGEGRFLRAFVYFGMVKRYGGVPIIDEVQDPAAPLDELMTPRATEYDCWKFIYEDLKFAMENMPETSAKGRANRYAAAALMSRAMLYAGSTANYFEALNITAGPAISAGLMGMKKNQAAEFYEYVIEAARLIESSNRYGLHDGANKEVAFTQVFIEDTKEDIFVKAFGPSGAPTVVSSNLNNSWDAMVLPLGTGMSGDVGSALHPAWDLLKLYQMPTLAKENSNGDLVPVRFDNLNELWQSDEMEARARGTFFFSGMTETASNTVIDLQAGVYRSFPGTLADATAEAMENDYMNEYRIRSHAERGQIEYSNVGGVANVKINGLHGISLSGGDEGRNTTGAVIRKYVNYNATPGERTLNKGGNVSWKVFRYAEVLLNRAEALYELGLLNGNESQKQEAFVYINQVRDRAGARPYTMVASPEDVGIEINAVYPIDENLQFIRDERARELAFENHRFFDLRRWRVLHSKFESTFYPRGLMGYYVVDEGKYIFLNDREKEGRGQTYNRANYHHQIPGSQINRNPLLIRNDGH